MSTKRNGEDVSQSPESIDVRAAPIRNPVTGEEHRAKLVLPHGFYASRLELGLEHGEDDRE